MTSAGSPRERDGGGEAELTLAADGMPSGFVHPGQPPRCAAPVVHDRLAGVDRDPLGHHPAPRPRGVPDRDQSGPGRGRVARGGRSVCGWAWMAGDVTDLVLRDQQQTRTIEVSPGQEHVLELWYTMPASALAGRARVGCAARDRSQVEPSGVLDADDASEHASADVPPGMTPELTWTWRGLFWGRVSRLQPVDLERWMGATQQSDDFPLTVNHYLFSSFGALDSEPVFRRHARHGAELDVRAALLAGLALIYVRRLRHPAVLFAAGVVLFTLILWYPDLAAALAQAAALGLLLSLTACVLKWMVDRRLASGSMMQGVAYASPDSQTVRASALQSPNPGATSTTTIPASVVARGVPGMTGLVLSTPRHGAWASRPLGCSCWFAAGLDGCPRRPPWRRRFPPVRSSIGTAGIPAGVRGRRGALEARLGRLVSSGQGKASSNWCGRQRGGDGADSRFAEPDCAGDVHRAFDGHATVGGRGSIADRPSRRARIGAGTGTLQSGRPGNATGVPSEPLDLHRRIESAADAASDRIR
jgi:hypothetical protein